MADKIDMSLDEIIKRDKISVGRGRRGGKFSNRPSTRGHKTNVRKIGATTRQMKSGASKRAKQFSDKGRKLPEKWVHDKFVGDIKSATLMISNLDYGVSDQDIRELFSEFGPIKKAAVHYDSSGRSLGKAEVIFFKITDSIRALKKYNGIPLDGRPMNIQPVVNATAKSIIASRIGNTDAFKKNVSKTRVWGGPVRSGRRGRGGKVGQRGVSRGGQKKIPTAAELDADLDAYTNKI